jgi:hypothetical protein
LKPYQKIIIERNEILGCSMVLEEYINDKGQPLKFRDEKSRCLGEIEFGFDRVFGKSFAWELDYFRDPIIQTMVIDGLSRTETDGGSIANTTRALLRSGHPLEQVKSKETTTSEKFYAYIKYDFGIYFI